MRAVFLRLVPAILAADPAAAAAPHHQKTRSWRLIRDAEPTAAARPHGQPPRGGVEILQRVNASAAALQEVLRLLLVLRLRLPQLEPSVRWNLIVSVKEPALRIDFGRWVVVVGAFLIGVAAAAPPVTTTTSAAAA